MLELGTQGLHRSSRNNTSHATQNDSSQSITTSRRMTVRQEKMTLSGPFQYHLSIAADGTAYSHHPDSGITTFTAPVTTRSPKIYIASVDGVPIYIGQTVQSIRARLRLGFIADGSTGYHGYAWRHHHANVKLDVWILEGADEDREVLDVETIEAEIVYLIRHHQSQWPTFQTEIHFHPSELLHRRLAGEIYQHYFPASDE